MKKQILIIPMLLLLTMTVFAFDYSITGDKVVKTTCYDEKTSFDAWHNDAISEKKLSQGEGTLTYVYDTKKLCGNSRITLNLNLKETYSYNYGDWAYSVNKATGTYWVKGILPVKVDTTVSYWYNKITGDTYIYTPYLVSNLISKNK